MEEQGHTVLGADCAGFGTRKNDTYSGDPFEQAAQDVLDLAAGADGGVVLVAHSMGSAVALRAYPQIKDKTRGIVLIEGNLIAEDCGWISRKIAGEEDNAALLSIIADLRHTLSASPYTGWHLWAEDVQGVAPAVLQDYSRSLVRDSDSGDLLPRFLQAPCPTLFVYGTEYLGQPVLTRLPRDKCAYIEGAGHFVMTEKPVETAQAIGALFSY